MSKVFKIIEVGETGSGMNEAPQTLKKCVASNLLFLVTHLIITFPSLHRMGT